MCGNNSKFGGNKHLPNGKLISGNSMANFAFALFGGIIMLFNGGDGGGDGSGDYFQNQQKEREREREREREKKKTNGNLLLTSENRKENKSV